MCTEIMEQKNVCLDQVMAERRSHRMFQPGFPPKEAIKSIIHAGLLAPFAAAAVGNLNDYFRRFFVMKKDSRSMAATAPLVMEQVTIMIQGLEHEMEKDPVLRTKAVSFVRLLTRMKETGRVPGIGDCSAL